MDCIGQPFSPCVQNGMGQKWPNQHRGYLKQLKNEIPYRKWPTNDIFTTTCTQLVPHAIQIRCLMNQPPDAWLCPWLAQPKQNLLTTAMKGDINVLLTVQFPCQAVVRRRINGPIWVMTGQYSFLSNRCLHKNWLTFDLGYRKGKDRVSICSLDWAREVD